MRQLEFFVPSNRRRANGMPAHMDGTNEIVGAGLTNRSFAGRRKSENTRWVAQFAAQAMAECGWEAPDVPVVVEMEFHETSAARDLDNIYGGAKYVLDALGTPSGWDEKSRSYTKNKFGCGAIVDDSQKHVENLAFGVVIDKKHPGVMVRVIPQGEGGERGHGRDD